MSEYGVLTNEIENVDEISQHIRECDRMYCEIYGSCDNSPHNNACKRLLALGFKLTYTNLPEVCIEHCDRWRLPEESIPPARRPASMSPF